MKKLVGFERLLAECNALPHVGWIFVDRGFDKASVQRLLTATFYVPENDDDEFFGEDYLTTWIEAPTFQQVIRVRNRSLSEPDVGLYAEAAIHYLEADDFLE